MIMMANMKHAAIAEVSFSIAFKALRLALITLVSVRWGSGQTLVEVLKRCRLELLWGHGGNGCLEFSQRVASALAAGVQSFRPGPGHALHKILEPGAGLRLQGFKAHPCCFHGFPGRLVGLLHLPADGGNDLFRDVDHRLLDLR